MTPMLEKGVSRDPRGSPIASFDHKFTPYILYSTLKLCLKGYWDIGEFIVAFI